MVDPSSRADRLRVVETVKAYCTEHSLQLAALILLPPTYGEPGQTSVDSPAAAYHKYIPLTLAKQEVWQDFVSREITEPVLMIQDCVKLLKKFHARVIVVSGCSEGPFASKFTRSKWAGMIAKTMTIIGLGSNSVLDSARRSVARNFRTELAPFGVNVASVRVHGPMASTAQGRVLDERYGFITRRR